ncbi:transcription factor [Ceraceosorus bombacis]|uniref:Transcription factor n=1 Tax=Ceraceosorus bombacis TaxID=401625 RepID=A0A0P1B7Z9_9BASI|nr:transcription factor [Ceraceosorus bombacis]
MSTNGPPLEAPASSRPSGVTSVPNTNNCVSTARPNGATQTSKSANQQSIRPATPTNGTQNSAATSNVRPPPARPSTSSQLVRPISSVQPIRQGPSLATVSPRPPSHNTAPQHSTAGSPSPSRPRPQPPRPASLSGPSASSASIATDTTPKIAPRTISQTTQATPARPPPASASTATARPPSVGTHTPGVLQKEAMRAETPAKSSLSASATSLTSVPGPSSPASSDSPAPPSRSAGHSRKPETYADRVASAVGAKKDRKRKRVHYSCAECHRRKHKCDRNIPCQACIDRGLADTCRPFEEGDQHGDMRDRVARLEDLVEGLAKAQTGLAKELSEFRANGTKPTASIVNAIAQQDGPPPAKIPKVEKEPPVVLVSDDEQQDPLAAGANGKAGRRVRLRPPASSRDLEREELHSRSGGGGGGADGSSVNGSAYTGGLAASNGAAPSSSNDEETVGVNALEGGLTREGDSFYGALALPSVSRGVIETSIRGERLELAANVPLRSASVKVRRLIQEGGAHPDIVNELMQNLPPRHESDQMLGWYFRDINNTRLPLHEHTFRQSYEELMEWQWGSLREEEGDDGARHLPFLSFLYVILAIAKRNQPEERGSDADARHGALKLFHTARRTMAVASAVRADHIDVLLAALFGCRFLICLRMSAESWSLLGSAIRAAQAIGLHRDGTKLGLDAVTTERRRRLWALIYYLDKTTSMLLGRPQGINDQNCDTLAPSDVDIDTLPRYGPAPTPEAFPPPPGITPPSRPPGVYAFVAIRHELAKLTGRVVEHFQNLSRPRNYADVTAIDSDLQRFVDALPPAYRCEPQGGTDRSFDELCPWLPLHRYLINVEQLYIRITLHRPYLLRSDKYARSRSVAFASAKADRDIRKEYKRDVKWPRNRARGAHMGGLYRLFNAALVAGIQLLLEPNSPDAPELHAALDDFLALKSNEPADTSQCTKREVAIIQLFQAKSRDPSFCAATATGAGRSVPNPLAGPSRPISVSLSRSTSNTVGAAATTLGGAGPGLIIPVGGQLTKGPPPLAPLAEWPSGQSPVQRHGRIAGTGQSAASPAPSAGTPITPGGTRLSVAEAPGASTLNSFGPSSAGGLSDVLAQELFDQLGAGVLDSFGLDHSPFSWDDGASNRSASGSVPSGSNRPAQSAANATSNNTSNTYSATPLPGTSAANVFDFWGTSGTPSASGIGYGGITSSTAGAIGSPQIGNSFSDPSAPSFAPAGPFGNPSIDGSGLVPWGGLIEAIVSGQNTDMHQASRNDGAQ